MLQPVETISRNGTDGRVYGGDDQLIHIPDGTRNAVGEALADFLEATMRANAVGRDPYQRQHYRLCPGCYMVAAFDMLTELARRNGQPLGELGLSMGGAFFDLYTGGPDAIEEIVVCLDDAGDA